MHGRSSILSMPIVLPWDLAERSDGFTSAKAKMVVLMEVLIIGVYVTVNLIVYVNDHMMAESMNQKLEEMKAERCIEKITLDS
ncbi:MAG: hypothetical protein ACLRIL_05580 [Fusicatenibacter saccharivorans]